MGLLYKNKGLLDNALEYYEKAYANFVKINYLYDVMTKKISLYTIALMMYTPNISAQSISMVSDGDIFPIQQQQTQTECQQVVGDFVHRKPLLTDMAVCLCVDGALPMGHQGQAVHRQCPPTIYRG